MAQFIGNILIRGKIECLTGLHIGGSKDKVEIGGVDSPVVRDPVTRRPYIPGSSLKGKMRMLLEYATGNVEMGDEKKNKERGDVHNCTRPDCPVCRIFGSSAAEKRKCGPTRLLVRDAYPDDTTVGQWDKMDSELLFAEMKSENYLNRITSTANPRFLERVVKGSKFDLEMVYGMYDVDDGQDDLEFFKHVRTSLLLLEQSALGGNGSRGYGQIKFHFAKPLMIAREEYQEGLDAVKQATQRPEDSAFAISTEALSLNSIEKTQWQTR